MPVRIIASSLALIGFVVAAVTGAVAGNPVATTIGRSLTAMGVCYVVGLGIGHLGRAAIREHIERYKQSHPIPDIDAELGETSESPEGTTDEADNTRHATADAATPAAAGHAQG
jgi:hypothetical protein